MTTRIAPYIAQLSKVANVILQIMPNGNDEPWIIINEDFRIRIYVDQEDNWVYITLQHKMLHGNINIIIDITNNFIQIEMTTLNGNMIYETYSVKGIESGEYFSLTEGEDVAFSKVRCITNFLMIIMLDIKGCATNLPQTEDEPVEERIVDLSSYSVLEHKEYLSNEINILIHNLVGSQNNVLVHE